MYISIGIRGAVMQYKDRSIVIFPLPRQDFQLSVILQDNGPKIRFVGQHTCHLYSSEVTFSRFFDSSLSGYLCRIGNAVFGNSKVSDHECFLDALVLLYLTNRRSGDCPILLVFLRCVCDLATAHADIGFKARAFRSISGDPPLLSVVCRGTALPSTHQFSG